MPSAFSWLMLVPSSLRLPAPVNQGVRLNNMSRAAFIFKTKAELGQMSLADVNAYIRVLQLRISFLNGVPRKLTEKQLEVVVRIRDSLPISKERSDG